MTINTSAEALLALAASWEVAAETNNLTRHVGQQMADVLRTFAARSDRGAVARIIDPGAWRSREATLALDSGSKMNSGWPAVVAAPSLEKADAVLAALAPIVAEAEARAEHWADCMHAAEARLAALAPAISAAETKGRRQGIKEAAAWHDQQAAVCDIEHHYGLRDDGGPVSLEHPHSAEMRSFHKECAADLRDLSDAPALGPINLKDIRSAEAERVRASAASEMVARIVDLSTPPRDDHDRAVLLLVEAYRRAIGALDYIYEQAKAGHSNALKVIEINAREARDLSRPSVTEGAGDV